MSGQVRVTSGQRCVLMGWLMRFKGLVLASTSMLAFAPLAPTSAQIAAQPPTTAAQPPVTAAPPQTGPLAATETGAEETIVVTGLRASLRSAQSIKRNSAQIVDAIVALDIGKLPDVAVSDTAARIPGVQVDRGGGEAGRVLVRGLPDFTTTYNGREIFTAETRVVALQDFPSSAIGALEVFKSTTADLVEAGLAGLINVRSRRPFDFDGLEVAGTVYGLYTKQAGKVTPNGNILIANRWDTGAGEFGALLSASYTRLQYLDSTRENTDFVADPTLNGTRVRFPDVQRVFYGSGNRWRPSVNAALQWRPSPDLEFYAEGLYQGFRNEISDHFINVPLFGAQSYSNLTTRPGTNILQSGTAVNPQRPDGFQGGTFNKTDTYQFAVGGSYVSGGWKLSADVARTDTTFTGSTASVDYALASPQTVDFNLDVDRDGGGAEFALRNFDNANPANYIYRGFYEEAQRAEGDDLQARFDVAYDTGIDILSKIEAGVRYVNRDARREFGNRYWNFEGNRVPIGQVPLTYELFRAGFRGSDVQPFRNWLAPTYDSIRDNLVPLRQFNRALGTTVFGPNTDTIVTADPQQTYDANEKTYAAYAQLRYAFGTNIRVDGVIGLRAVKTELSIAGTSNVDGVFTPVAINRDFTDWLPNASARVRFDDRLALRLSATQTRTRPNFSQLNPSANLGAPPTNCNPSQGDPFACARSGNGGNPFLNPFTSNNYDAGLEYYFSSTGFVAGTVFRRDLDGFFQTLETRYVDPGLGPIRVNAPVNSGKGRIDGFEAQFSTFLDFAGLPTWAKAFGVQANVTYLDAKTGFPNAAGTFTLDRILGVSDWAYNLAAFYENNGLSTRLSYNYRSGYLATRQDRGDDLYTENVKPISRLDLSVNYDIVKNFTIFGDWVNILGQPFRSTLSSNRAGAGPVTFPRLVRFEETTVSLGARFRF
jgi:iron complex outermembrane recepter protein